MKYIRETAKSSCLAISFHYGMSLKPLYFLFNSFLQEGGSLFIAFPYSPTTD